MAEHEGDKEHKRMRRLREVLEQEFNREELRILCSDLNIPYDNLGAEGHRGKVLEVVFWCQRHTRLEELEAALALPGMSPLDNEAWREAMERYKERIEETCGWMQILGQTKPAPLDEIFTEVYLLDKPTAWRRFSLEQLQEEFTSKEIREQREKRLNGLALVREMKQARQSQRLFILGKPGAGKTTFLKQVALQAARQELGSKQLIPIFVSLKALADSGKSVLDFIIAEFEVCQLPTARGAVSGLLRRGEAIILFDGLDEVLQSEERQASLVESLQRFAQAHPKNQYLVTCRIAAADYTFVNFAYVEMADFTPPQVETFVGKWFREDPATCALFLTELRKPEHRPLQELATVPLLLTLLCLAFEETLTFPQRRVELYEEALDALLKKWDSSRRIRRAEAYHKLSLGRKRELFAEIAWQGFEQGHYFMPQAELATHLVKYLQLIPPIEKRTDIDGEAILQAIEAQHGILVERARRIYAFAHLTFQEYYTARYVVEHHLESNLLPHTSVHRWREVLLLVTNLLPRTRADMFFEQWAEYLVTMSRQQGVAIWLVWVNDATPPNQPSLRAALAQRSLRLDQSLTFASIFDRDRDFEFVLDSARTLNLAFAEPLDLAFSLAIELSLVRSRLPSRDTDLAYAHVCARDLDLTHAYDLGMGLVCMMLAAEGIAVEGKTDKGEFHSLYQQAFRATRAASDTPGLKSLYYSLQALEEGVLPSSSIARKTLANDLRQLAMDHLSLPPTSLLTQEAISTLETYLASTRLLLECLEVAHVSNKEAILDALLRPPGWTRE